MHINHQYKSRICHEENENSQNRLVFNTIQSIVSFFPQMRPEKKAVEMTIDELDIFSLLDDENTLLSAIKEKSGFSGKKWDSTLKSLTSKGFAKVSKTDEGLFLERK